MIEPVDSAGQLCLATREPLSGFSFEQRPFVLPLRSLRLEPYYRKSRCQGPSSLVAVALNIFQASFELSECLANNRSELFCQIPKNRRRVVGQPDCPWDELLGIVNRGQFPRPQILRPVPHRRQTR